jgi:hypothetical protein
MQSCHGDEEQLERKPQKDAQRNKLKQANWFGVVNQQQANWLSSREHLSHKPG